MWQNYIAMGDSVTAGVGDPVAGIEMRGWTDWLADSMKALLPDFTYINLGRAGSTTGNVLREQLPLILERMPDLVSVTTGANDARFPTWSIETFSRDFNTLLQPVADQGTIILTMTYPYINTEIEKGSKEIPREWQLYFLRLKDTNSIIREVSAKLDACLLDLENYAPAYNPAHISSDMVHPNAPGHKVAGEAAFHLLVGRFDPFT